MKSARPKISQNMKERKKERKRDNWVGGCCCCCCRTRELLHLFVQRGVSHHVGPGYHPPPTKLHCLRDRKEKGKKEERIFWLAEEEEDERTRCELMMNSDCRQSELLVWYSPSGGRTGGFLPYDERDEKIKNVGGGGGGGSNPKRIVE